jgi:acetoin utilization protein AcuB
MALVSEVMNRAVVAVAPDDSIENAEEIARRTGADHLLVLDEETLVGILCACDLERAEHGDHVCDRMSLPVLTVRPDTPLEEAAETLGDCDLGCLPVALGGLILGTLGNAELERAGLGSRRAHGDCRRRARKHTEH